MDFGQFSTLLAAVYDASLNPSGWQWVSDLAARAFESPSCLLQFQNRTNGIGQVLGHTSNFTPEKMAAYTGYYYAHDLWATRAMEGRVGKAVLGAELVPEPEIFGTELYNDWLRPTGIFDLVGGSVALETGDVGLVGIHRTADAPRFDQADRHWMEHFLKHFGRALDLQNRLGHTEHRLNVALEALELLDVGVVVVNARALVIYANGAAEQLLGRSQGIVLDHKVLSAVDSAQDANLKRMIQGASLGAVGKSISAGGLIAVPRADAAPLTLLVCPLSPNFIRFGSNEPVAMIFLGDSEANRRLPQAVLTKLYGFSATEGHLACALLAGQTIQGYAARAGVTANTARSQLKSMFAKTGHSRQAALIRDLASNPVLRMMQS
jgi:DNA-binding CsgD family transcriptional regulator/PAS domain-containing protein